MPMGKGRVWWWVVINGNQWTRLVFKRLPSTSKMKNCVITNKSPEKSRYHSTQQAAYSGENPPHSRWTHRSLAHSTSPCCWTPGVSPHGARPWRGAPAHSTELHHIHYAHHHAIHGLTLMELRVSPGGQTLHNNMWRRITGEGNRVC